MDTQNEGNAQVAHCSAVRNLSAALGLGTDSTPLPPPTAVARAGPGCIFYVLRCVCKPNSLT